MNAPKLLGGKSSSWKEMSWVVSMTEMEEGPDADEFEPKWEATIEG